MINDTAPSPYTLAARRCGISKHSARYFVLRKHAPAFPECFALWLAAYRKAKTDWRNGRPARMREYHRDNDAGKGAVCKRCGKVGARGAEVYCSNACYWAAVREQNWPVWADRAIELYRTTPMGIARIAQVVGERNKYVVWRVLKAAGERSRPRKTSNGKPRHNRTADEVRDTVMVSVRTRIRWALKRQFPRRRQVQIPTTDLIGCDKDTLLSWIGRHLKPGMTWENYGQAWHIDHKLPCASFDLTDSRQARKCFNYRNLQPEFAADNMAKSDKLPGGQRARSIPAQLAFL